MLRMCVAAGGRTEPFSGVVDDEADRIDRWIRDWRRGFGPYRRRRFWLDRDRLDDFKRFYRSRGNQSQGADAWEEQIGGATCFDEPRHHRILFRRIEATRKQPVIDPVAHDELEL